MVPNSPLEFVILLSLLVLQSSATDSTCPVNPSQAVHLPDPTDCGKFLTCVWGNTVRQSCPAGLHWNERLQVCDWPSNAQCQLSSSTPSTTLCNKSELCTIAEQIGLNCSSESLIGSFPESCP